jgi:hypothetical protein
MHCINHIYGEMSYLKTERLFGIELFVRRALSLKEFRQEVIHAKLS